MTTPTLLIVTGHPATGKTTLARALAAELGLPLISKDDLKEAIFDSIGWRDRDWSRQVGVAAIALMYIRAEAELAAGRSLIVESNFRSDLDTGRLRALRERAPFRPAQIRCVARGDVMAERYARRIVEGRRHPGHCEALDAADLARMQAMGEIEPVPIGGALLTVDTSTATAVETASVATWARAILSNAASRLEAH